MKDFSNCYAPKKTNTLFMKYQNKGIHVELVGIPHEWHAVLKIGTHAQWILLWTKIQNSHLPPSLNVADSSIGMISRGKIPLSPTKTEARAANNHGCSSNSSIKVNKYSGTYPAKTESTALLIVFFYGLLQKTHQPGTCPISFYYTTTSDPFLGNSNRYVSFRAMN